MNGAVLIVSNDALFAQSVMARWQKERTVPAFTVLDPSAWRAEAAESCRVAIVAPGNGQNLTRVAGDLDRAGIATLAVAADGAALTALRDAAPHAVIFRITEDGFETLVLLAIELLKREDYASRLRECEQVLKTAHQHATLGRYMLEERHNLNNALTSLLGNAELMMLEPEALPPVTREQVQVVHSMALRLHEIIRRFTSLETDLRFAALESQAETPMVVRAGRGAGQR